MSVRYRKLYDLPTAFLLALLIFASVGLSYSAEDSFLVFYGKPASPILAEMYSELSTSGALEEIAEALNPGFNLPTPITISIIECGEANAFYLPDHQQVAICYELLVQLALGLRDREEYEDHFGGIFAWILLHEIGHAFVHVLDLPITGLEEDAVDQLATLWLLEDSEEGAYAVGATAGWFAQSFEQRRVVPELMADQHSLNAQRFFNIMCWAYGSDPENNGNIIDLGYLSLERASTCQSEFQRMKRAWELLLNPYIMEVDA